MRHSITIATYNILHGLNLARSGRLDLTATAETIAALDADIVGVQEVDRALARSGEIDQVAWLADTLGWHGVFTPALLGDPERAWLRCDRDDPGGPAYGVGLLSRRPISEAVRHPLPGGGDGRKVRAGSPRNPGWDREPRVALSATVATDAEPLRITTAHLSYLPWRGVAQLRAMAKAAAGGDRALLVGDFNLPPGPVRASLRGWDVHLGPATYPASDPRMHIDHIVSRGHCVTGLRTSAHATSDHLPLIAEVT